MPIAALSVVILALGHSLIDFSLQISGYAIVVFALTGTGIAQSFQVLVLVQTKIKTKREPCAAPPVTLTEIMRANGRGERVN